jgi:5-methylcytosine-specific restriction endonuclease McrA
MSGPLNPILRAAVFLRDKNMCVYCGSNVKLEADHVVPTAHGGKNEAGNLVAACHACNHEKGVIHVDAFYLHRRLRKYPNTSGQSQRVLDALKQPVDMGAAYQIVMGAEQH